MPSLADQSAAGQPTPLLNMLQHPGQQVNWEVMDATAADDDDDASDLQNSNNLFSH